MNYLTQQIILKKKGGQQTIVDMKVGDGSGLGYVFVQTSGGQSGSMLRHGESGWPLSFSGVSTEAKARVWLETLASKDIDFTTQTQQALLARPDVRSAIESARREAEDQP
jgi:hypothetical protein